MESKLHVNKNESIAKKWQNGRLKRITSSWNFADYLAIHMCNPFILNISKATGSVPASFPFLHKKIDIFFFMSYLQL